LKVKIIDFGIACYISDRKSLSSKCGTPGYCDPLVLEGKSFTEKSDVFSLGCVLYYMLAGEHLIPGKKVKEIILSNIHMDLDKALGLQNHKLSNVSHQARDLLKLMLSKSIMRRPTSQKCLDVSL